MPVDILHSRQTPQAVRDLVASAAEANMNMIRVWGGGLYYRDEFYDACDAAGLLVWQEAMFACSLYPANKEFLDDVRPAPCSPFALNVPVLCRSRSSVFLSSNGSLQRRCSAVMLSLRASVCVGHHMRMPEHGQGLAHVCQTAAPPACTHRCAHAVLWRCLTRLPSCQVREEITYNGRRLGSHASLAIWGGGNEVEASFRWFPDSRDDPQSFTDDYMQVRRRSQSPLFAPCRSGTVALWYPA